LLTNHKELKKEDVKWMLIQTYKAGDLRREDISHPYQQQPTATVNSQELTLKYLIVEAYKAGELAKTT